MNRNRITLLFLSIVTLLALTAVKSTAQDLRPGPNIAGNWTIYAYNVDKPGSSLKTIEVTQNGNIISGIFHGPHQHGKFQGWINGNHIEFSTDTTRCPHLPRPDHTRGHVRPLRRPRSQGPVAS